MAGNEGKSVYNVRWLNTKIYGNDNIGKQLQERKIII